MLPCPAGRPTLLGVSRSVALPFSYKPLIPGGVARADPVVAGQRDHIFVGMPKVDLSGLSKRGLQLRPPGVIEGLHQLHPLRMLLGHVCHLPRITLNVIQFLAIDQSPLLRHHRRLLPLDWITDSLGIGHEHAIRPVDIGSGVEQSPNRHTVPTEGSWRLHASNPCKRGNDVDRMAEHIGRMLPVPARRWPVGDERHTVATVILASLLAPHPGVEHVCTSRRAVVGCVNEERVLSHTEIGQHLPQAADVVVDVGDHPEEGCNRRRLIGIEIEILLRTVQRPMRRVGADIGEERLLLLDRRLDKVLCGQEEHIRTEALSLNNLAVVEVVPIEVGVIPDVWRLPNTTTAVSIHLRKATVFWTVGEVVAKVPLTKHPSCVAAVGK